MVPATALHTSTHRVGYRHVAGILFHHLWRTNTTMRSRVWIALGCLLLAKVAVILTPPVLGHLVDLLSVEATTTMLFFWVLLCFVLLRFAQVLFTEIRGFVFSRVVQRAIQRNALAIFRHIHSLSLSYHLSRRTGSLHRMIDRGVKSIEFLVDYVLFSVVPTLLEVIAVCILLGVFFDWWLTVICLATILIYILFTVSVTRWRLKLRRQMNDADQNVGDTLNDSIINYETVKYFGAQEREVARLARDLSDFEEYSVQHRQSLSLLNVGQSIITVVAMAGMMMLIGHDVLRGDASTGDFVTLNFYLMQLYLPLNFLGTIYREIRRAITDMEEMLSIAQEEIEVNDLPDAPAITLRAGAVSLHRVSFAYGERTVLHDVSFHVPAGSKVAIVGHSGSGKSTIARLLLRFYDVRAGAIQIDGQDIARCTQLSVQQLYGVVPQDCVLFNRSIYDNIAYGEDNPSDAAVHQAARVAQLDDFIRKLPQGYDTLVGERGLKLSGGEKQRIAIARAVIKKPAIFLFDEATSSLDSETEAQIQRTLNQIAMNKTTIVVAHRLSTVMDADEIIVLSEGRIVERGRHDDLRRIADGHYARMWDRQQEKRIDASISQEK